MVRLGNPPDADTQALVLAAAEQVVIAEIARIECLAATTDIRRRKPVQRPMRCRMISVLTFLNGLNWIDGRPLQIEEYRKDLFRKCSRYL
jgi:hypothetical protein